MKDLTEYNVEILGSNEMQIINGGGIGRWLAKGIKAVERGIYYLFKGQYDHVQGVMEDIRERHSH